MVRRMVWWLFAAVLPLALIGAGPWAGMAEAASGPRGKWVFDPVALAEGQSLKVVLAKVSLRPGEPQFPPSPCDFKIRFFNEQGDQVGTAVTGSIGIEPVQESAPARAGELQAVVNFSGPNARDCSGVVGSVVVTGMHGNTILIQGPKPTTARTPLTPNMNGASYTVHVLAPLDLAGASSLHLRLANVRGDIGHAFPPSPCDYQVQAFGGQILMDDDSEANPPTSGSLGAGRSASFEIRGGGIVTAVVLSRANGCRSFSASGTIGDVSVPVLGNTITLSD
jgi:hypothetical protein